MNFLQIIEPVEQSLLSHLGDQMFSIVLLVFFAIYSIRKQMQQDEKLQKYMDEDRKEMKEVINQNTKALETINLKLGSRLTVLLIGASMLAMSSCSTFRKHTETSVSIDTVLSFEKESQIDYEYIDRETKDTVINIESCVLEGQIGAPDLKPIYTLSGDTLPRSHTILGNGIAVDLSIGKDGSLAVKARTEAKKIIIPNLIKEKRIQSKDREKTSTERTKSIAVNNSNTVKKTSYNFPAIAFVILLFVGAFLYFFKSIKKLWTP